MIQTINSWILVKFNNLQIVLFKTNTDATAKRMPRNADILISNKIDRFNLSAIINSKNEKNLPSTKKTLCA